MIGSKIRVPSALLAMVLGLGPGCAPAEVSGLGGVPLPNETPTATQRAYLSVTNRATLGPAAPTTLRVDLLRGAQVQMEVAAIDGEELRFKIYRQGEGNSTHLEYSVASSSGFVVVTLEPSRTSSYLVTFPASGAPRDVVLWLDCKSGRCTAAMQPGERCGGAHRCESGLHCQPQSQGAFEGEVEVEGDDDVDGVCSPRTHES